MSYFLYTIFFISCITLIASVLLQPGKTDAGALFTSNISSSAFNPRGTQSILAKISITAAVVFMLSALFLAMPALTGNISVLQTSTGAETPAETAPALTDGNANVDVNAANTAAANGNVTVVSNSANTAIAPAVNAPATNAPAPNAANTNK